MEAARLLGAPHAPPRARGGAAAGAPGHGRRRRAGADGDAGRLRRRRVLRPGHLHHRHLQGLAGDGRPHRRGAAGDACCWWWWRCCCGRAARAAAPALCRRPRRAAQSAEARPLALARRRARWLAWALCALPVLLGFVLPVAVAGAHAVAGGAARRNSACRWRALRLGLGQLQARRPWRRWRPRCWRWRLAFRAAPARGRGCCRRRRVCCRSATRCRAP